MQGHGPAGQMDVHLACNESHAIITQRQQQHVEMDEVSWRKHRHQQRQNLASGSCALLAEENKREEGDEFVPPFVRWAGCAKQFVEKNLVLLNDKDIKIMQRELGQSIDNGDAEKASYYAERLAYVTRSGIHPSLSREIKHFVYMSEYMDRPSHVLWELFPSKTKRSSLAYERLPHEKYEAPAGFFGTLVGAIGGAMLSTGKVSHWVKKSKLLSRKTWYNPMGYRTKYIMMMPATLTIVAIISGLVSGIAVFALRSFSRGYHHTAAATMNPIISTPMSTPGSSISSTTGSCHDNIDKRE